MGAGDELGASSLALVSLGRALKAKGYRFVTVTPETHRRVLKRKREASTLETIFGWNLPFEPEALAPELFCLLEEAGAVEVHADRVKSGVRFATIDDLIFVHSSFPTAEHDTVFFGPDTYRFAQALRRSLGRRKATGPIRLIDIGCGSGAAGIFAARLLGTPTNLVLSDINRRALEFSAVNAAINECSGMETVFSDVLADIEGDADIIIANPPYLVDEEERLYRHGGGALGFSLALRIVEQSLDRLRRGGRLVLYTGVPIVSGTDPLFQALRSLLQPFGGQYSYEEIDPDVFGEELDKDVYATADRIAVVVLTAIKDEYP